MLRRGGGVLVAEDLRWIFTTNTGKCWGNVCDNLWAASLSVS